MSANWIDWFQIIIQISAPPIRYEKCNYWMRCLPLMCSRRASLFSHKWEYLLFKWISTLSTAVPVNMFTAIVLRNYVFTWISRHSIRGVMLKTYIIVDNITQVHNKIPLCSIVVCTQYYNIQLYGVNVMKNLTKISISQCVHLIWILCVCIHTYTHTPTPTHTYIYI